MNPEDSIGQSLNAGESPMLEWSLQRFFPLGLGSSVVGLCLNMYRHAEY